MGCVKPAARDLIHFAPWLRPTQITGTFGAWTWPDPLPFRVEHCFTTKRDPAWEGRCLSLIMWAWLSFSCLIKVPIMPSLKSFYSPCVCSLCLRSNSQQISQGTLCLNNRTLNHLTFGVSFHNTCLFPVNPLVNPPHARIMWMVFCLWYIMFGSDILGESAFSIPLTLILEVY